MIVHSEPSSTVVSVLVCVISFEAHPVMDNATVNPIAIIILFFMEYPPCKHVDIIAYTSTLLNTKCRLICRLKWLLTVWVTNWVTSKTMCRNPPFFSTFEDT